MATQNLVEQTVLFITPTGQFDEAAIYANSLIQSLANNSAGKALVGNVKVYRAWDGTQWTNNSYYEIKCFVSSTFQTTIQSNMTSLQAAFPQYQVVTYGNPITFGS